MSHRRPWIIVACGLFAAIGIVIGWILHADASVPDDADLRPIALSTLEDDGFPSYLLASKSVVLPIPLNTIPDEPELSELVARNEAALLLADQALGAEAIRLPECIRPEDPVPSLLDARNLARLLILDGERLDSRGERHEALERYLDAMRLGRFFMGDNATVMAAMIGVTLRAMSFEAIVRHLERHPMTAEELHTLRATLRETWLTDASISEIVKCEYRASAFLFDKADNYANAVEELLYKPNATKHLLVEIYSTMLDDVSRVPSERQTNPLLTRRSNEPKWRRYLRGNAVGENWVDVSIPQLLPGLDEQRFLDRALDTALAIRLFHLSTGRAPATLDELVPHELDRVPTDPLDGELLRYDVEKRELYCPRSPTPERWAVKVEFPEG